MDCDVPDERLAAAGALHEADAALRELPRNEPSPEALLRIRRELSREVRGDPAAQEIMTLDEVAAFLRLSTDELGELVAELPVFELAGRIRIRRARLLEWIERREQDYVRQSIASRVARTLAADGWKGVA